MASAAPPPQLDALDLRLLDFLQHDASLSNQALAERAHVSPATCLRRVRRLVELGVIERTVALLSPDRLGAGLTAVVEITLDHQAAEKLAAFEDKAVAEAAVQQCYRTSSGPDFVLIVQVRDMAAYHTLVQRLFTTDVNVRNVKTYFSVKRSKFEPAIALPSAPGASSAGG
ncbi:Lrp/AsnC family transcriptional regulator [Aquabacterium sp. A7-Y]|uniref:Lrp/AsnC family transcriptional regulator n=1 Tax=Aquabacterium sp. A7-Y TaxID=1349605 RepID=UPI00223D670B|nr:Lrp/AsnC family transcriptional regulator [Aquabacterium sp. A7-Y]MCW7541991.1 Lrp/AsnC family transcriptional regulator [Aquabacterium sp. A7-Y]